MGALVRGFALAILAALLAAPLGAGAPRIGGPINAAGTARAQIIPGQGVAVAGGAFDETIVCTGCLVDAVFDSGTILVVQQGQQVALPPGAYEFRDFDGVYGYSGSFAEFHGEGVVSETASL